jgi:hypothetical protein
VLPEKVGQIRLTLGGLGQPEGNFLQQGFGSLCLHDNGLARYQLPLGPAHFEKQGHFEGQYENKKTGQDIQNHVLGATHPDTLPNRPYSGKHSSLHLP